MVSLQMHNLLFAGLILVTACYISYTDGLATMSIDLGSEFMKIAIVKPGVPMEIVLNRESRRKTPSIVSMRNSERAFGDEALNTAVKFPKNAYIYLRELLGKSADNPVVKQFRERFPYYNVVYDDDRKTFVFQHDEETTYSTEELLAMILQYAKEQAVNVAEQPITDAVIVVPSYYNQAERRALLRAAGLAGINVLQLMNDNAAVALNYGVFRRKFFNTTAVHYMFYDMGATSTTATIVGYQVTKTKEGGYVETNPQVSVKGVGFDKTLGGLEIQLRLRDHLAKLFNEQKKTPNDVTKDPRAMAKLYKEAGRVKQVLSANSDHFAQIEGLLDDKDFRAKVSRQELEDMCADLFARVGKPVEEALKSSHMTMDEITEVILMGGSTRVPKVQEVLKKAIGREELGKSINTDEAAALGAVYQAAHLSKGFRVLKFPVKNANLYPIQVDFKRQKVDEDGKETSKTVTRTLFGRNNPYPQKKVMTFNKHTKDFSFNVNYGELSFLSEVDIKSFGSLNLTTVNLSGVADALDKHSAEAESKGIKAHFRMDDSGILNMDKVETVFEKPTSEEDKEEKSTLSKLGDTITNFFSGSKDGEESVEPVQENEDAPESINTTDSKPDKSEDTQDTNEDKSKQSSDTETDKTSSTSSKTEDKEEIKDEKTDEKSEEKTEGKTEEKMDKAEKKTKKKTDTQNEKPEESNAKTNKTDKEEVKEKKPPKPVVIKEDLKSETTVLDLQDPSKDVVKKSKDLIEALKKKDVEKHKLEKAKNELEAFIFNTQDKLYNEDYEKCSTEEERETLRGKLADASDWLYDQEATAGYSVYEDKLGELKKTCADLFERVKELEDRPKAFEALRDMLNYSTHFYKSVVNFTGEDLAFTQVEADTLGKLINETKQWKKEMEKEQEKTPLTEKPKVLVGDIGIKLRALDREVKYLLNKAKTFVPKVKPTEKESNTTKKGSGKASNETKPETGETKNTEETEQSTEQINLPPPPTEEAEEKRSNNDKDKTETKEGEEEVLQLDGDNIEPTETTTEETTTKKKPAHDPDDEL